MEPNEHQMSGMLMESFPLPRTDREPGNAFCAIASGAVFRAIYFWGEGKAVKEARLYQKCAEISALLTMSCFRPTKDCSTELAVNTCLLAAAFSPRKRSIRSLTASP